MSIQDAYDAMVRDKAANQQAAVNTFQSKEWIDLPTMADVARAKFEGWEIEVRGTAGGWCSWIARSWSDIVKYRGRPKQPKTITLRKALFLSGPIGYWTTDCDEKYTKSSYFIKWIGEPYQVEVPE